MITTMKNVPSARADACNERHVNNSSISRASHSVVPCLSDAQEDSVVFPPPGFYNTLCEFNEGATSSLRIAQENNQASQVEKTGNCADNPFAEARYVPSVLSEASPIGDEVSLPKAVASDTHLKGLVPDAAGVVPDIAQLSDVPKCSRPLCARRATDNIAAQLSEVGDSCATNDELRSPLLAEFLDKCARTTCVPKSVRHASYVKGRDAVCSDKSTKSNNELPSLERQEEEAHEVSNSTKAPLRRLKLRSDGQQRNADLHGQLTPGCSPPVPDQWNAKGQKVREHRKRKHAHGDNLDDQGRPGSKIMLV